MITKAILIIVFHYNSQAVTQYEKYDECVAVQRVLESKKEDVGILSAVCVPYNYWRQW